MKERKERPVNLRTHEVIAILEGRKTHLRRMINPQPPKDLTFQGWVLDNTCGKDVGKAAWAIGDGPLMKGVVRVRCPFGEVGDRLWVRETWASQRDKAPEDGYLFYRADGDKPGKQTTFSYIERESRWRPSVHMPRFASRILLEITAIKVEQTEDGWFWVVDFKRIENNGGAA